MDPRKNETCDLSDVILNETDTGTQDRKSLKRPKRVLHFSDGDLEEYSEDETDVPHINATVNQIDPVKFDSKLLFHRIIRRNYKSLNWLPWAWYQTTSIGNKVLEGCDCVGEWLAGFFGITSPKYQFEINEFYRVQALEKKMQHKQDLEMGGWNEHSKNNIVNNVQ